MANIDGPRGFVLRGRLGGGEPSVRKFAIDSGTATAIYTGDLAKLETDGSVAVMAAQSDDMLGAVVELYDSSGKPVNTLAASTAGSMVVCDDPYAEYIVQFEDGGTAPTVAALGDAADAIWTHAGANSRAGVELSETLASDGSAAQFRILQLVSNEKNDWGHNAKVVVTPLEHAYNTTPNAI